MMTFELMNKVVLNSAFIFLIQLGLSLRFGIDIFQTERLEYSMKCAVGMPKGKAQMLFKHIGIATQ